MRPISMSAARKAKHKRKLRATRRRATKAKKRKAATRKAKLERQHTAASAAVSTST